MKITSSKDLNAKKTPIMAADEEDPFADMGFEEEESQEVAEDADEAEDSIEDMSDTLDELNDALSEIDEDKVDIEMDNNIDDHYIAECDKCHNVFITSVVLSDQEIEKISGICPICDEESDQYLKWIIKDVKQVEQLQ